MMVTQGMRAAVSPGRTWIKPFQKKKTFRKIIITGETFAVFNLLVFFCAGTYLTIRKIRKKKKKVLAPVVQTLVNAIHRINLRVLLHRVTEERVTE